MTEFEKQEKFYLDNIIWLWKEYDRLCQELSSETNPGRHGLLLDKLDELYHGRLGDAYDAYYKYFGRHCTYQPNLSHLA